jgi:hypothetical protein
MRLMVKGGVGELRVVVVLASSLSEAWLAFPSFFLPEKWISSRALVTRDQSHRRVLILRYNYIYACAYTRHCTSHVKTVTRNAAAKTHC